MLKGVDPTKFATDNKVGEQFIGEDAAKANEGIGGTRYSLREKSVEEYARERGYTTEDMRQKSHHAPNSKDGFSASLDKMDEMIHDIYSPEAYRYYGYGTGAYESIRTIQQVRNNPDAKVTIYRAVPKSVKEGSVRNGDWVTLSRDYAKEHGVSNIDGAYRIIEETVPAKYLYTDGNSVNEFGYDDGKEYAYSNTKNNKKLLDEVTYDDNVRLFFALSVFADCEFEGIHIVSLENICKTFCVYNGRKSDVCRQMRILGTI